eukprot:scaffold501_cov153-Skeletonema_marinoi.AAC.7
MKNSEPQQQRRSTATLLISYFIFGALHESAHLITASWLLPASSSLSAILNDNNSNIATLILRIMLGRCINIPIDSTANNNAMTIALIKHSGWIFSMSIAILCHALYKHLRISPVVPLAAYITALEGLTTDLFGFIPQQQSNRGYMTFFCGNFGILLLNSSWLSIDGGRTALDVLEKMVNVTMMRGAQSGGVVTFEPTKYSHNKTPTTNNEQQSPPRHPPTLKGIRSRVVNAKRTDLSKIIKQKIIQDNCSPLTGNLHGYNKSEYTVNEGGGKLVRGFFGHTRFATSSKASFEGTHPHQWSARREYNLYSFGSASSFGGGSSDGRNIRSRVVVEPRIVGVENYITHNGVVGECVGDAFALYG